MKNIATLILEFAIAIFVIGIPAHPARRQTSSTAHMGTTKVTQGDNVSITLVLDKASNLAGSIGVTTMPEGVVNGGLSLGCNVNPGQTQCTATSTMALDAKLGKWVVSGITFTPFAGQAKALAKHGDSLFEVVAHGEVILPDSATVSDIK